MAEVANCLELNLKMYITLLASWWPKRLTRFCPAESAVTRKGDKEEFPGTAFRSTDTVLTAFWRYRWGTFGREKRTNCHELRVGRRDHERPSMRLEAR
jgi:hypothetical protein